MPVVPTVIRSQEILEMITTLPQPPQQRLAALAEERTTLIALLSAVGVEVRSPEGLGFACSPGGLETLTRDGERVVGLHLDSWYGTEPHARRVAPGRFIVNVGTRPRCFLFVPELRGCISELKDGDPVVHLEMDPGDILVARTECFVHDGSSHLQPADATDLVMSCRGFVTVSGPLASSTVQIPERNGAS